MYKVATYSNRLYLDENSIDITDATLIENNIIEFNNILYGVYNLCFLAVANNKKYKELLNGDSLFKYVKNKYNLNTYYANSIIRLAEGKVKSQQELQKLYIKNVEEKIDAKKQSIKHEEKILTNLRKMQKCIEEYRLKIKNGKKAKLTTVKSLSNIKIENNIIYIKQNKQWVEVSLSKLEYEYIFPQIRHYKNLLGKYKHRLDNLKHKLEKLQTLKRIIFGTKRYMKEYSKQEHSKLDYLKNKYKSYELSGRCDFKYGNMMTVPLYNSETNTFEFKLTLLNDTVIYLKNIKFPYRQDELIKAIYFDRNKNNKKCKKNGIPINCKITRHYDEYNRCYYQIGVVFDIETTNSNINYDKSSGIVALDFNLGHIDMTELDDKGNLVYFKTFKYTLSNKAYINEKSLYNILDEVGEYAKQHHKVLAVEELDLQELKTKFNSDKKHQKTLNRYLHSLPYSRYNAKVQHLKIKYELDVITVKPNFTSIIGELKYANSMKLNSHISASYVIGRRALGFVDYPLNYQYRQLMTIQPIKLYKSNWSMWSTLNKMKTT